MRIRLTQRNKTAIKFKDYIEQLNTIEKNFGNAYDSAVESVGIAKILTKAIDDEEVDLGKNSHDATVILKKIAEKSDKLELVLKGLESDVSILLEFLRQGKKLTETEERKRK